MKQNPDWEEAPAAAGSQETGKEVSREGHKAVEVEPKNDKSDAKPDLWAGWEERQNYRRRKQDGDDNKYKDTPWRQRGWSSK